MKISLDGGGLCLPQYHRFGNYTFSANLIEALSRWDKGNTYYLYSFCTRPRDLHLKENVVYSKMGPKMYWMSIRVTLEEIWSKKDIFLALNQALPIYTSGKIFGFSHGLAFKYYPGWYKDSYRRMTHQAKVLASASEILIVPSRRVADEFAEYFPGSQRKVEILNYGIPFDFLDYKEEKREPFFVFTGMNHPIKNIKLIIDSFAQFRLQKSYKNYRLYLIGPHNAIAKNSVNVEVIPNADRQQMRNLLRRAKAYITISHYESFNLPVLEALSQKCPVIGLESAIIRELKKYCMTTNNAEELPSLMIQAAKKEFAVDRESLMKEFSWETYVKRLIELY